MLILPYDINCGYFDSRDFGEMKVSPKRTVTKYEIELFTDDADSTYCDGVAYPIVKDHIKLSKPGQTRYSNLPFCTNYLKFSVEGDIAQRLNDAPQYFKCSHPEKVKGLIEEITLLKETDNSLLMHSKILAVLNLILCDSNMADKNSGENYEIIANAKKYIEQHCCEPIHLSDIARSVNLSNTYFHNLFSSIVGLTPHNYLIECRISTAKKMLWNSDHSISEIAEKCGFGCQQYFNKVFKKHMGITPGRYRKNFIQNYLL